MNYFFWDHNNKITRGRHLGAGQLGRQLEQRRLHRRTRRAASSIEDGIMLRLQWQIDSGA